jgi:DNA-binding CsgD family transcriptional regulator
MKDVQRVTVHRPDNSADLSARVARLTAGQRACLDLVDDHATSKEIARQLGISRHTVDARLRQAIQILGVSSRREAAIIWRAAASAEGYQPFAYQMSRLEAAALSSDIDGHDDAQDLRESAPDAEDGQEFLQRPAVSDPALRRGVTGQRSAPANQVAEATGWALVSGSLPDRAPSVAPALRLWGGANDLTPGQRLAGMLIVMIAGMLAFGLLLSGMAALIQLRT